MTTELFPFAQYWWFYVIFTAFVVVVLSVDLGVFHRKQHIISLREASIWVCVWTASAALFNVLFYQYAVSRFGPAIGSELSLQFLAGYLVEESLSVDNIFVFVLLFRYFGIPPAYQHRILFFGIIGAIIFRGVFIALGAMLVQYHLIVVLFGVLLIFTGIKMFLSREELLEPANNPMVRLLRRVLPVTHEFHGQKFVVRIDGVLVATPLLIALLVIETTDIVFAVDSVPAVYGLTREPLIVFTSNIFAILGLRSLYFVLADAIDRFHYLKQGVALVLVFVGLKMTVLPVLWGGEFPIGWSVIVICIVLAISIALSLLLPKKNLVNETPPL
jgi:tellurite resistance protein TerC